MTTVTVTFAEHRQGQGQGVVAPLEVEGPAEQLAFAEVSRVLFDLRVQVVWTDSVTTPSGLRHRFGVCEFDAAPLAPKRKRAVTESLRAALGTAELPSGVRSTRPDVDRVRAA